MLLCIANLLKPIDIFDIQLQLRGFQLSSISSSVKKLISKLENYKTESKNEKYNFGATASKFLVFRKDITLARVIEVLRQQKCSGRY